MEFHFACAILSGLLVFASDVSYFVGIVRGHVRPNVPTFLVWTFLQCIAIAGQLSAGASGSIVFLIVATLNTAAVAFLGIIGYGYHGYTKTNIVSCALAVLALLLWYVTKQPLVAIIVPVLADFFGTVPLAAKAYSHPETEQSLAWWLFLLAAITGLFATSKFDAPNLLYPAYTVVQCLIMVGFSQFGPHVLRKPRPIHAHVRIVRK